MKVLYLTNLPAPYRVSFFNELGKYVDLTVLYERKYADDRDKRWTSAPALSFREIYLKGMPFGPATAVSKEVLSYVKDPTFEIIVIGGYSSPTAMLAIAYMNRKKIPYILSIDGGFPGADNKQKKKIKSYFLSGAALYLSTGTNADRYLIHYGADKSRIMRYRFTSLFQEDICTTPPTKQEKETLKKQLQMPLSKKTVLYVGRLLALKRHDLVISAAETFPDVHFIIIGGKPDSYHQALLDRSGVKNVQFIDFMPYNELSLYYRATDVFFMPSDADVWGLVLAEALAHGLPAIATCGCGAAEDLIFPGENGYIAPKGDKSKLCEYLHMLLHLPESNYKLFQKNSLDIIKEYTIEHEVRDHLDAFHRFSGR